MRQFWKMHGLGNDFVIADCRESGSVPAPALLRRIADRRLGVGCDQVTLLLKPTHADADVLVRFFNVDGSEAGACGNASRCVAHLLLLESKRERAVLQTAAGLLPVWGAGTDGDGQPLYAVEMGAPEVLWQAIPLTAAQDTLALDLDIGPLGGPAAVNVGNPHAVFFVPDVEAVDLAQWGPLVERHPLFPQRTNVEVCHMLADGAIRMRVWERGSGITPACGSGAVAALVAASRRGLTGRKAKIVLDGGVLQVEWREDGKLVLTGAATPVFDGWFSTAFLAQP